MTPNYSIYSIPVYWLLAMAPQMYAMSVIKAANNKRWNGANPHGYDTIEIYKKACPREVFLLYERAKGAHRNLVEGAPWFIGAIVLGNSMGMAANYMNFLAGAHLLTRVLYIVSYIKIRRPRYAFIRSLLWGAAMGFVLDSFVRMGKKAASA